MFAHLTVEEVLRCIPGCWVWGSGFVKRASPSALYSNSLIETATSRPYSPAQVAKQLGSYFRLALQYLDVVDRFHANLKTQRPARPLKWA